MTKKDSFTTHNPYQPNFDEGVPEFIKRECNLRGISVTQFFDSLHIMCSYVERIRKAFNTGFLDL